MIYPFDVFSKCQFSSQPIGPEVVPIGKNPALKVDFLTVGALPGTWQALLAGVEMGHGVLSKHGPMTLE